ncbi:VCBS domain-containing protein, partial [Pseudomaricurvus sp. HS19]|uniref:VCBS domain-containing protein n=1 Tax=Pseudomaricurvus sp. HS19 TaxID=2692626 RepID=UPI0013AAB497
AWLHFDAATATFSGTPANGDVGTTQVTVIATDRHGAQVSTTFDLTVHNVNDAPTLTRAVTDQVIDEHSAFSCTVPPDTFTDIDSGDTLTLSTGTLPAWLSFDASTGTFTGTPGNGDLGTTQVTVTATDSAGAQVSTTFDLTVNNVNDPPVLAPVSHTADEGSTTFFGSLTATDPDAGETFTYSTNTGAPGFNLNRDGTYSFDPSNGTYNHLAAGQQQDILIPITVMDSHGGVGVGQVQIKLIGTDDAPKVAGHTQVSLAEDARAYTSQLSFFDPDSQNSVEYTTTAHVPGFTLNADGSWVFDPSDAAYQSLAEGEPKTLVIPVTVTDSTGVGSTSSNAITIELTGTNDAPVVSHVITAPAAHEGAAFSFGMPADTFADVDSGDTLTLSTGTLPAWLSFDAATGTFSGTPDNGDVGTTQVTVTATDSHGAQTTTTFDLTVNNVNDAPTLNPISSVSVQEDGIRALGTITAQDADAGDHLTYSIANPVDGLVFNADGNWQFDPSHATYQSLTDGQVQTLTIPVTVTDAAGATDTQNLVISITGTDDRPVFSGAVGGSVTEDTAISTGGHLVVSDTDSGESAIVPQTNVATQYGTFSIDADGNWQYQANNNDPVVQNLNAGDSLKDTIRVVTAGGDHVDISIVIDGADEAASNPVVTAQHVVGNSFVIQSTDSSGGFALDQFSGATMTYSGGTAAIDPATGMVQISPTMTGNPHDAHYGEFEIYQHGVHVADVHVTSWNHAHTPSQIEIIPIVSPAPPPPPPPTARMVDVSSTDAFVSADQPDIDDAGDFVVLHGVATDDDSASQLHAQLQGDLAANGEEATPATDHDTATVDLTAGGDDSLVADQDTSISGSAPDHDALAAAPPENVEGSGNDYLDLFKGAGAEMHDSVAASTGPDETFGDSLVDVFTSHGAVMDDHSAVIGGMDPAALADFLDQQDQAANPQDDSHTAVISPDDVAAGLDPLLDDPTLTPDHTHHQ